jgi:hypothetical protein
MNFERIAHFGVSRLERIRVRSALNPILWLSVSVPIISWAAAFLFREQIIFASILIAAGCLPILTAVLAYMILLFRSPDRLQSEEYQLRQKALQMLYRKGGSTEIVDVANQVVRIETSHPRIGPGEDE